MNKFLFILIAVCIFGFPHVSTAQNGDDIGDDIVLGILRLPDLQNEADQQLLKQRAKECVKQMNSYITSMTKKAERDEDGEMHPTRQDREDRRLAALQLFLNDGEPIILPDGTVGKPVQMETSVINQGRTTTKRQPVKDYFTRLINLIYGNPPYYAELTITSCDIESMDVTNIQRVGDKYECVVTYYQDFIGRRPDFRSYADWTKKQIKVFFVPIISPWGDEIVPRLGDISVKETQRR